MIRVGIIGFGFMGRMHDRCWRALPDVRIAAVCDPDAAALKDGGGLRGNIAGASESVDLSDVAIYSDPAELFAHEQLDAVSITVPTYLQC